MLMNVVQDDCFRQPDLATKSGGRGSPVLNPPPLAMGLPSRCLVVVAHTVPSSPGFASL